MITFTHTADIHFGIENYGKIDPTTGIHTRLLDFDRALNFCIDYSIEKNVDLFLFCGDAYKTTNPTPTQQKLLFRSLIKLYKANIPVVIIIGNHDNPASFGKAHSLDVFSSLPIDGFHVVCKPEIINLKTKNGPLQILGVPWPTRHTIAISDKHITKSHKDIVSYMSKSIGNIITSFAKKLDPNTPSILAGHLSVSSGVFSGSEKRAIFGNDPTLLPSQLAIEPFDYVALGHLHRYQNLNKNGHPAIIYPGSVERIDFGERKEDKGFCLVNMEASDNTSKNNTTHEFIKTPTRNFIQIEVKLESYKDHTTQIINELDKHDLSGAVIKILYHVPEKEKDKVDLQIIQQKCAPAMHIVGIIPIRKNQVRERRSDLKVSMDFATLIGAYLDTKPDLKKRKQELIEKALILFEESKAPQKEGP
ncbi:exonuclease SbcCD subunit D [Candidatus Dependentiae bacterium]